MLLTYWYNVRIIGTLSIIGEHFEKFLGKFLSIFDTVLYASVYNNT